MQIIYHAVTNKLYMRVITYFYRYSFSILSLKSITFDNIFQLLFFEIIPPNSFKLNNLCKKNPYVYVLTLIGPTLFAIKKSISILTLIFTKHLIFYSLYWWYFTFKVRNNKLFIYIQYILCYANFRHLCKNFDMFFAILLHTSKR